MIKFLFYLFLIYIIYKLIFGRMVVSTFKRQMYNDKRNQVPTEEEGSITVNPKIKDEHKSGKSKIGEYVDFEEIK